VESAPYFRNRHSDPGGEIVTTQIHKDKNAWLWKVGLIGASVAFLAIATALQAWIFYAKSSSKVYTDAAKSTVTTTTTHALPPTALVTTVLGFAAVLFLAGAFFDRLTKLLLPGGIELDFSTQAAIVKEAVKTAKGDAEKSATIAHEATKMATAAAQVGKGTTNSDGFATFLNPDIEKFVARAAEDTDVVAL
jgi:hypothetical protein